MFLFWCHFTVKDFQELVLDFIEGVGLKLLHAAKVFPTKKYDCSELISGTLPSGSPYQFGAEVLVVPVLAPRCPS
jgi:hypothetical protein